MVYIYFGWKRRSFYVMELFFWRLYDKVAEEISQCKEEHLASRCVIRQKNSQVAIWTTQLVKDFARAIDNRPRDEFPDSRLRPRTVAPTDEKVLSWSLYFGPHFDRQEKLGYKLKKLLTRSL